MLCEGIWTASSDLTALKTNSKVLRVTVEAGIIHFWSGLLHFLGVAGNSGSCYNSTLECLTLLLTTSEVLRVTVEVASLDLWGHEFNFGEPDVIFNHF